MENIDKLLEEYRAKGEAALVKEIKDYPSFGDMERDYCNLINYLNISCINRFSSNFNFT